MNKSIRKQYLEASERHLIFKGLERRLKDVIKYQDKERLEIATHRAESLLLYIEYLKDESKNERLKLKEESMNKYRSNND